MAVVDRRQPHPAPAGRAHPGPAGRAVRRPRGGRLRALQRRAARQHRGLRAGVPRSPSGPGCCWCRTAASCAAPSTSATCLDDLHASRLGHGVRAAEDPALLDRIVAAGVPLEVCPVSNVALGVYTDLTSVPLPTLLEAGATVALGADDPLLFGSRLAGAVRHHAGRPRPRRRPARRAGPDVGRAPRARPGRRQGASSSPASTTGSTPTLPTPRRPAVNPATSPGERVRRPDAAVVAPSGDQDP